MLPFLSLLRRKKQAKDADGRKPLLDNTTKKHTENIDGEQILKYMESTDQSGVYFDQNAPEVEGSGERVLSILREILHGPSIPQDFDTAAAIVKSWGKLNGITMDNKEGSYPQVWLCEFLQEIDQFVEQHFPKLPTEGGSHTQLADYLKLLERVICYEVLRLAPLLKDAGLLDHLIDSFSHQLFTELDLLLKSNLSENKTFYLLQWGKRVFFSPDSPDVFRVHDPLQLSRWFEGAKQKLLQVLQNKISKILENILSNVQQYRPNGDSIGEEAFIRVHLDVIQCLNAVIINAKEFSLILMHEVQKLCCEELHSFVQMYVHAEKKHLEKLQAPKPENSVSVLVNQHL
ncbi:uncharacterized protein LOC127412187 [Myxocyprinus asiaticus]|uniref:uncharacterized protein LOC127412187 n=1 Tax=Myxocyprinus asiaticus TaxID=70543 RepID=UPI002223BDE8|nr:uncharacterized protein LOC127412187 [Myxocyprinus asiaticus]